MSFRSFKMLIEHHICNSLNSIEMYMYMHLDEKDYKYVEKFVGLVTFTLEKFHIIVVRQHEHFKRE